MNLLNTLETKRLRLKQFNPDNFEAFSYIFEDVDVSNNLKYVLNNKPEHDKNNLFRMILDSNTSKHPLLTLAISTKFEDEIIGSCGLITQENGKDAEIFYTLLPRYRGYGYAIEAMKKLIEFAFIRLNLTKLMIFLHPNNSKAWRVAERVGMKYLGQREISTLSSKAMFFSIEKAEFDAQSYY
ncbi:MAG: GNAT family N-acetyltransferase [Promethearchaeota archaeon]